MRQFAQATRFRASNLVTAASEMIDGTESTAQVRATRHELAIPLVVISAGPDATPHRPLKYWTLSKRACQAIAEKSGHAIPLGQPKIVVEAIRATVDASRQPNGMPDCNNLIADGQS